MQLVQLGNGDTDESRARNARQTSHAGSTPVGRLRPGESGSPVLAPARVSAGVPR